MISRLLRNWLSLHPPLIALNKIAHHAARSHFEAFLASAMPRSHLPPFVAAPRKNLLSVLLLSCGSSSPSRRFFLSPVRRPFSATHFPGHCFGLIPASCSFTSSAFPVPPQKRWVPSHKAAARFGSSSPRFWVPQENGARKRRFKKCLT